MLTAEQERSRCRKDLGREAPRGRGGSRNPCGVDSVGDEPDDRQDAPPNYFRALVPDLEASLPSYSKTILCLANSWKPGGRCVAGKVITPLGFGEWMRPIGTANGGAVSYDDRHYDGGADPALLDVIEIQMSGKSTHAYQPENHQIDDNWYWKLKNKASPSMLTKALDPIQPNLWGTSPFSSGGGINDRVLEQNASSFSYSLRLISIADLLIRP